MTARVTQQVVTVAFSPDPKIRVSTIAVEVLRSIDSSGLTSNSQPVLIVVVS